MTDANSKKTKGKATKPKKIAYAGKEPTGDFHYETMNITLPNDDEIKAFKYEQNFSDEQMNDLLILLNHIYLDLDIFNKNQITENDRKTSVKAIFEIAQQVHKLKSTIDKHINILGQILPMNVMECIGESLDLSFSNAVLVDNNAYIRLNRDLNHIKQETVSLDAELIATLSRPRRQVVGLQKGHLLLQNFIGRIDERLQLWISLNKQNKGGRPRKYAREYLLFWLVYHAKELTGHNPPNAKEGWFVDFAKNILELCGLSSDGVGSSLPKIIKDVNAKKKQFIVHA